VKLFIAFVGVVLLLGAAAWYGYRVIDAPPQYVETHQLVEIPPDVSFKTVASILSQKGLIVSRWWFRLLGKIQGAERKIKPGEYDLHTRMRPGEILNTLVRGKIVLYPVLVPEGLTARQISALFSQAGLADEAVMNRLINDPDFVKAMAIEAPSLEGYLFPDTYYFPRLTRPEEILKTMVGRSRQMFTPELRVRAANVHLTEREVVILASIIEKETGQNGERSMISAVFHNRLKKHWPLQSDPTVIYDIPGFDGNLTRAHLTRATPYNTYMHAGLPPGPIANPGLMAIMAALDPAPVDYLYFVSRNDGTHQFSATLAEHNRAVDQYQKRNGRRSATRKGP
jgi:UPF0755 protein